MRASLRDYSNPNSFASKFRRRRFRYIEALVQQVLNGQDECKIIDVGGTAMYWNLMSPDLLSKCIITISNLEKVRGSDPHANVPLKGSFVFHYGDGCDLRDISAGQYDIAHSNSVVEHVGRFADMEKYCRELTRVGRYYYPIIA